jgi:hypothetical protein
MGFGLWKKIKNGFKKVWGGLKKAGQFVYNKVIKPIGGAVLPIAGKIIGGVVGKVHPGIGAAIEGGAEALGGLIRGDKPQEDEQPLMQEVQYVEAPPPTVSNANSILSKIQPRLRSAVDKIQMRLPENLDPRMNRPRIGAGGHGIRKLMN